MPRAGGCTAPFVRAMPPYLPWHLGLVYLSGVFEVAGGIGLLVPRVRVAAAWGLIALYVAVFPANVHMALHADELVVMREGRVAHHGPCADRATHEAVEAVFDRRIVVRAVGDQWVAIPATEEIGI